MMQWSVLPRVVARRRSRVAAAALGVVVVLGMTACAGGGSNVGSTPVAGGTLVFAQGSEPECLDPSIGGTSTATGLLASQYVEPLVGQDKNGDVIPWLASSWVISNDQLSYDFTIRDHVTFSDGEPLTAQAVKVNFDRILSPEGGAGGRAAGSLIYLASTEVISDQVVRMTLTQPFAPFLEVIAQPFLGIQSPKALERSVDENCASPVGTGPFAIKSYTKGSEVILVRNKTYSTAPAWSKNPSEPYLDEIDWRFIPDGTTRFGAVASGQVDISDELTAANQIAAKNNSSLAVITHDYPGVPVDLTFNVARAPFDDQNVRQAFLQAVDLDAALGSALQGTRERVGMVSPTTPMEDPQYRTGYAHDPAAANKLLDKAGWTQRDSEGYRVKDGKRLSASWLYYDAPDTDGYNAIAEQFQASAKEVGFEITLRQEPIGSLVQLFGQPVIDADIFIGNTTLNSGDVLRRTFGPGSVGSPGWNQNPGGISDPQIDAALADALATTDPAARKAAYDTVQRVLFEKAYGLGIFALSGRYVLNTSAVTGVGVDPTFGYLDLRGAWTSKK